MSNPLAEYLTALEARDAREKAHEDYINAYTKLADRTATLTHDAPTTEPNPSAGASTKTAISKGKGPASTDDALQLQLHSCAPSSHPHSAPAAT
ncbi:hypothetical protein P3342_007216 [Pyrenophora teres f. teres]|nr:hypothetical protein P3342_007216 [Pyrenophora teres f. teres]